MPGGNIGLHEWLPTSEVSVRSVPAEPVVDRQMFAPGAAMQGRGGSKPQERFQQGGGPLRTRSQNMQSTYTCILHIHVLCLST